MEVTMAQAEYVSNAICALITGASAYPPISLICAAHAEFVATLERDDFRLIRFGIPKSARF